MKTRILALMHLFVLIVFLAKPILPYIEYLIFKDYIAKNLCENRDKPKSCCEGKCHLQKQLKKNSDTGETTPKNENKKHDNKSEVKEFINSEADQSLLTQDIQAHHHFSFLWRKSNHLHSIFIPPEA